MSATEIKAPRPITTTCGWCIGHEAKTAALIAQGYDVSHSICSRCKTLWLSELLPTAQAQA